MSGSYGPSRAPSRLPRRARRCLGLRPGRAGPPAQVGCDIEPGPGQPRPVPDPARVPEVHRRGEGHRRHHRDQMRRRLDGGQPLDRAGIRQAEGADAAGGPGLRGGPLDRVETVLSFLCVGRELAAGGVAATHVLDDHGVAARHGLRHQLAVAGLGLAVGCAVDQRGMAPSPGRTPHVGAEHDTVAHRHGDVPFDSAGTALPRRTRRAAVHSRAGQERDQSPGAPAGGPPGHVYRRSTGTSRRIGVGAPSKPRASPSTAM